jgi:glycosyltransferase involved in cell wall biosynthesis
VSEPPLRIALLGGVPATLGGGGLELQLRRTWAGLERRGHEVFHVAHELEPRPFDVLHAFSSGPDVHFQLEHWRRNPAPFVVSPVVVVAPGRAQWRQRVGSRLPIPAFGPRMRVEILARADVAVALTEHEAALLRAFAGDRAPRIVVIPNGVDPAPPAAPPAGLPDGYVALVGTVSARKRQAEAVAALGAAGVPPVVAGGFEGSDAQRAAFERAVAAAGGRWLGEVDGATAQAVTRGARALVHLSSAEGQSLSVLEALAAGTPAIVSPLPSNRELAAAHPAHVRLCAEAGDLPAALAGLPAARGEAPSLPTWDDVAARLEDVYRAAGA